MKWRNRYGQAILRVLYHYLNLAIRTRNSRERRRDECRAMLFLIYYVSPMSTSCHLYVCDSFFFFIQSSLNLEDELRQQQPKANVAQFPVNLPPPPPPLLRHDDIISDGENAMLDSLSFEEIVEDVLSTLKNHPEILKELEEGK